MIIVQECSLDEDESKYARALGGYEGVSESQAELILSLYPTE